MSTSQQEKELGNQAFSAEKYPEAIKHYTTAFEIDPTLLTCILNRSFAYLKSFKYKECIKDTTYFFQNFNGKIDPVLWAKGLYRQGMAHYHLTEYEDALWCLEMSTRFKYNPSCGIEMEKVLLQLNRNYFFPGSFVQSEHEEAKKHTAVIAQYNILQGAKTEELKSNSLSILYLQPFDLRNILTTVYKSKFDGFYQFHIGDQSVFQLARFCVMIAICLGAKQSLDNPGKFYENTLLFHCVWGDFRISDTQRSQLNGVLGLVMKSLGNDSFPVKVDAPLRNQLLFIFQRWKNMNIDPLQYDPGLMRASRESRGHHNTATDYYFENGRMMVSSKMNKLLKQYNINYDDEFKSKKISINPLYYCTLDDRGLSPAAPTQALSMDIADADENPKEYSEKVVEYWMACLRVFSTKKMTFTLHLEQYLMLSQKLNLKFDRICTNNIQDYQGVMNLAVSFVPMLKPNGRLYTQILIGFHEGLAKLIQLETGNAFTGQEFLQLSGFQCERMPNSHGHVGLVWRNGERSSRPDRPDLLEKLVKMLRYITSFEQTGGQGLMTTGIMGALPNRLIPQYSIYGWMKLAAMSATKKDVDIVEYSIQALSEKEGRTRRMQLQMCSDALNLGKKYFQRMTKHCVALTMLDDFVPLSGTSREDHLIGIMFKTGSDYDLAREVNNGPKLHQYLNTLKIDKIDIETYRIFPAIAEFHLPGYFARAELYDHDAYHFALYDYKYGAIRSKGVPFVKFFACACCGKNVSNYKYCSACMKTTYCSVECQKNDWPQHKLVCKK